MNQEQLKIFKDSRGQESSRLSRVSKGLIGLGISAAFVTLALRGVDLVQVRAHLWEIDTGILPAVLISLAVIYLSKAFRWRYLLFPLKRVAFGRSLSAITIGFMANNAVPLRGGDLLRAHLLGRQESIGTTTVFATVMLDRIFEVLSLFTMSLVVLLMIPLPGWIWNSVIILGLALLCSVMGIVAFHHPPKLLEKFWKFVRCLFPRKVQEVLSKFIKQVRVGLETGKGKVRLTNLYILAVGESVLWGTLVYCSLRMLGIHLSIVGIMSVVIGMNLAVLVPTAPGNIGVFEFAVMTILEFFGFNKNIAFSGAVTLHAISVIPISIVGLIFFIREWLVPKRGVLK